MLRLPRLRIFLRFLLIAGSLLSTQVERLHAQLEQLANRVPKSANTLVVINAKAAFDSPLARAQGWEQQGIKSHEAGMTALPTGAEEVLLAAQIDFELMHPLWEIALAHVREMPDMNEIATRSGGRTDRLAGVRAVERPNDSFVVSLGPRVIGAMSPANRQHVIRWVRESQRRKSPELSPYLAEALQASESTKNHIVLALDLQGVFAPDEIEANLEKQEALLKNETADLESLSEIIAGIRGIRMEVVLADPPQGRVSIDFEADAAPLQNLAKPLLLHVLNGHGANIDDINNWQSRTKGSSVALSGKLSQSGLRRVLSVLSSPVGPMASTSKSAGSTSEDVAAASQRYFQSVTHYLNDLFVSDFQPQSLFQARTWVERYARKIGDLDTHQVDPEVLSYAGSVMDYLNEIVSVIGRTEKQGDVREAFLYQPGQRRFNRYGAFGGYVEKPFVARDRNIAQADVLNQGLQQVDAIVKDLRAISAQTRETMTERYDRKF
jgi:hypothetical protein